MTADLARLRERLPWVASQMRDNGMYTQAREVENIVPLLTELEGLRTELKHRCVCRFTSGGNLKGELCAYHKRLRNDEAEGLRRDAERYRWLRDGDADTDMDDFPIVHGASTRNALFGEDLDSAIDAAKDAK